MSDVLVLSEFVVKNQKVEGEHGNRIRLTEKTKDSLKNKINNGTIDISIKNYNKSYSELLKAYEIAEEASAEQEARNSVLGKSSTGMNSAQAKAKAMEDNLIANITSVDVTKPRLNVLNIDVQTLEGKFGTFDDQFAVPIKEDYTPKALSVPKLYSSVYGTIMKNGALYKLSGKFAGMDPRFDGRADKPVIVANWKLLFGNSQEETPVQEETQAEIKAREDEAKQVIVEDVKGISQEELSRRKMVGDLGSELKEVAALIESYNGKTSPFYDGLIERKNILDGMLSKVLDAPDIAKAEISKAPVLKKSELQDFIDSTVGYSEPLSEEEYNKKAQEMEDYYSQPEVGQIIEELKHKDILYTYNNPEVYDRVMEAERKNNKDIADKMIALDVLDIDAPDEEPVVAAKPEPKFIKPEPVVEEKAKVEVEPLEVTDEELARQIHNQILREAQDEAVIINNRNEIKQNAEEQAEMLAENGRILIAADEEARLIRTKADADEQAMMLINAEENKQPENNADQILADAQEQARIIKTKADADEEAVVQYRNKKIKADAQEQARIMKTKADVDEEAVSQYRKRIIKADAQEQARIIKIREDADQEAQMQLSDKLIKDDASKQARIIKIREDADEEAQVQLNNKQIKADASKEAEMIKTKKDAEIEAQMLQDIDEQIEDLESVAAQIVLNNTVNENVSNAAREEALTLKTKNEVIDAVKVAVKEKKDKLKFDKDVKEQAKMIHEKRQIEDGAKEEAELQQNKFLIRDGSMEQAKIFKRNNMILDSAEEQAKILKSNNDLLDATEEEAKLIYKRGKVLSEANEQAKLIQKKKSKPKANYVLVDTYDRYGIYAGKSKPIKLRQIQMQGLYRHVGNGKVVSLQQRREELTSFKEELEKENFDFLKINKDLEQKMRKAA